MIGPQPCSWGSWESEIVLIFEVFSIGPSLLGKRSATAAAPRPCYPGFYGCSWVFKEAVAEHCLPGVLPGALGSRCDHWLSRVYGSISAHAEGGTHFTQRWPRNVLTDTEIRTEEHWEKSCLARPQKARYSSIPKDTKVYRPQPPPCVLNRGRQSKTVALL